MSSRKIVLCGVFGHDWELLFKNNFKRTDERASQFRSKRCVRCGKRESSYSRLKDFWLIQG